MTYQNAHRIFVEKQIARFTINTLLAEGFTLGVNDGEETVLEESTDATQVFEAMFTTDEDYLSFCKDNKRGYVFFVYGNDGVDVISDYTTGAIDKIMTDTINVWIDMHERLGYFPVVELNKAD